MLRSIMTCRPKVVSGVTWTRTTNVVLPLMQEQNCSASRHATQWWSDNTMPQNVVVLMMLEHKAVQHQDLLLKSGRKCHMNTCHECGLTANAGAKNCSAL